MSAKAKAFKNLYRRGMITRAALERAVSDGVITQAEFLWIVGEA